MAKTVKVRGRPAITLTGTEDLENAFKSIIGAMDPKKVAKVLLEGAKVIRDDAKRRVKNGPSRKLKKAIRAKVSRRLRKTNPSAFAAVDRKKAPHAALVEFGHALVLGGKLGDGGTLVGQVPAHPFMGPAAKATKNQVAAVVKVGLARGIQAVVKKPRRRKPK